jgi:cysteine desulfurase/selenocysteine lyase
MNTPDGLPEAGVLEALARELYGELAGLTPPTSAPVTPPSGASLPGMSMPPMTSVSAPTVPLVPPSLAPPMVPAVPTGAPSLPFSTTPSFYFLENAVPVGVTESPKSGAPQRGNFDVPAIRRDFPILSETVEGQPLVWLDNAATTQKPERVIARLSRYYEHENSNVHRGAHTLAARATDAYEGAREKVRGFLNAGSTREIVWVRGATEAINLVAQSWGRKFIQPGDEIVLTWLEHHSNIVPWQLLAAEKGAIVRVAPVDDDGQILFAEYERLLGPRTRLVAMTHVSNALGTITPVREMVAAAHRYGAAALVDGAQAVSHMPVDVQALDADFYVLSGHKLFAPTGIGVLYGKEALLQAMPPWQGGGNMISDVTFARTVYADVPAKFEAGTGSIADAVGLGAAIDYLTQLGMQNIARYEHDLLCYATEQLKRVPGLRLVGTAREKASVQSFVLDGYRAEEVGQALARQGIAVRAGHHCAQPCLRRYGLESSVRPSLAFYNDVSDVDALVRALFRLAADRPAPSLR